MDRITVDLVDDLALGAGILAAGGGPVPWQAAEPLRSVLVARGPVPLLAATALERDAFVLPVAVLGGPADGAVPDGAGIRRVVRAAEERCGRRCTAVVALEIGGLNALAAVFTAAVLGLPCVNGDGMRRGFARLDLTLFGIGGLTAAPALVSDGDGNLVTVESPDNRAVDRLVQATVADMGGMAVVGAYPMTAAECARTVANGSLRYCIGLGAMIRSLRHSADAAVQQRLSAYGVQRLFTGRIAHVARNGGRGGGTATVESLAGPAHTMRIDFQHGNLIASEDGVVRTTVPDLISVVDAENWLPAQTGDLAPDRRVHVLAIPADERWRSAAGIAAAGPRQFGYDIDYEPLSIPNGPITATSRSYPALGRPGGRHHPEGVDDTP